MKPKEVELLVQHVNLENELNIFELVVVLVRQGIPAHAILGWWREYILFGREQND